MRWIVPVFLMSWVTSPVHALVSMKCVALMPFSHHAERIVLFDTDHDGLGEVICNSNAGSRRMWSILEYRPVNRFEVVQADTGTQWAPESLVIGNFAPTDAGDVDRDGKTELVGEADYADGIVRQAMCIVEAPDSHAYPDSLVWAMPDPTPSTLHGMRVICDLDRDSLTDIVTGWHPTTAVFENVADDSLELVAQVPHGMSGTLYQVADFDQNGRTDFAFNWPTRGTVEICECSGDNQYAPVCSLNYGFGNTTEMFHGEDVDGNGKPEFFVVFATPAGMYWRLYLYQFEAEAEHDYAGYFIDTTMADFGVGHSLCVDLDLDGVQEVVWACGAYIRVLKAVGPRQFERVGYWYNDGEWVAKCNTADFNGNGYPEVYVGGDSLMSVIEVEAIRVLSPNGGRTFVPGDTCTISWRVFTPPRCDSVSLFLRSDTTIVNGFYRLDTIVTGLSQSESTYSWVVPDTTLDSARILAIAYGPGWQFDESDSPFRIAPAGMQEARAASPQDWALSVWPNPVSGKTRVSYDVPRRAVVHVGLYDAAGRLAEEYASGELGPGRYHAAVRRGLAPGVYFLRLNAAGRQAATKLAVLR